MAQDCRMLAYIRPIHSNTPSFKVKNICSSVQKFCCLKKTWPGVYMVKLRTFFTYLFNWKADTWVMDGVPEKQVSIRLRYVKKNQMSLHECWKAASNMGKQKSISCYTVMWFEPKWAFVDLTAIKSVLFNPSVII